MAWIGRTTTLVSRWLGRGGSVALLASLLAAALYAGTLAPGLTWAHDGADGGDLLAAALTRGVPHPTGYPTYQVLLRAAIAVFPGEPARAGNLLSALCAALAVGLLADLARRTLPPHPWRSAVALAAALTWAASPALWSQAVLTEVYALNALAVLLLLWLLGRWGEAIADGRPGWGLLVAAGCAGGLGIGNHVSLVLLLPGVLAWLWANRRRASGVPKGGWAAAVAAFVGGLAIYACLPVAAVQGPPINWGDPSTPAGFRWVVSAEAYRGLVLRGASLPEMLSRLSAWTQAALGQLGGGPWGALIAAAGFWWADRHRHGWWRTTGLIALAYSVFALAYRTEGAAVYLIPVWAMTALWLAWGLSWAVAGLGARVRLQRMESLGGAASAATGVRPIQWAVVAVALVVLPGASLLRYYGQNDLSHDREARAFVADVLAEAQTGGLVLTSTDRPTFALWYAIYGLGERRDLIPLNVNLYDFDWYRATLARWHPALFRAGGTDLAIEALLLEMVAERPVYRAEALSIPLQGFAEEPGDALVRIRRDR